MSVLMTSFWEASTHNLAHCEALADSMHRRIEHAIPGAIRLGNAERRLPHILSMRLPGIVGHTLLERCDARGIAFSTGSACHGPEGADQKAPVNHVLAAIGLDRRQAREVVRISFSHQTSEAEGTQASDIIAEEAGLMARIAPIRQFGEGVQ